MPNSDTCVAGPETVRNFLGYIHRYWKQAPRYVVLAGDGTYDYLNQLGYNDTLIPPVLVTTPNGLFASDTPYADINGDGVMEFAVGRLPARSGTELQTMISKITTYEAAGGAWTDDALLLADNADGGGAFDTESDALVRMLTNRFSTTKCYLGSQTITNARTQLLGAWQAGVAFVNYAGHGALDRMAQEGLLTSSDVTNLTNGTRLPVVVSMTCVVGPLFGPRLSLSGRRTRAAGHRRCHRHHFPHRPVQPDPVRPLESGIDQPTGPRPGSLGRSVEGSFS
jgi:hypothetical protein